MSKALSKVTKHIKDKRDSKSSYVHPGSRDHKRLVRASIRQERLRKRHTEKSTARDGEFNRLYFFQDEIKERHITVLSQQEIKELIQKYIDRDNEERKRLAKERRPGRPPSSKEDILRVRLEREEGEYRTGFRIPDLTDTKNVGRFTAWNGTLGSLSLIAFTRIVKGD